MSPIRLWPLVLAATVLSSCTLQGPTVAAGTACETRTFIASDVFSAARRGPCRILGDSAIRLTVLPEDDGWINPSPWYAFRITPKQATTARVELRYATGKHRYPPKVSTDGVHWEMLDAAQVQVSDDESTVTLSVELDSVPLWIAAQELVTPPAYEHWSQQLAARSDLEYLALGRSLQGRPINILSSDSPSDDVLFLVGRQHPPEVSGAIAFFAFVEALMAETPTANAFREHFDIIAIPMLNPDGVVNGNWRHNLGGTDLNRDWGPFLQPETQLIRDLLDKLDKDGRNIRVFLDFHSTQRNVFYDQDDDHPSSPAGFADNWLENARPRVPGYPFEHNKSPPEREGVAKNYMYQRYGIPSLTYEVGDETDRDLVREAAAIFADELMKLMLESTQESS